MKKYKFTATHENGDRFIFTVTCSTPLRVVDEARREGLTVDGNHIPYARLVWLRWEPAQ